MAKIWRYVYMMRRYDIDCIYNIALTPTYQEQSYPVEIITIVETPLRSYLPMILFWQKYKNDYKTFATVISLVNYS